MLIPDCYLHIVSSTISLKRKIDIYIAKFCNHRMDHDNRIKKKLNMYHI